MKRGISAGLIGLLLCFPTWAMQDTDDEWAMDDWPEEEEVSNHTLSGFFEIAVGARLQTDPVIDRKRTLQDVRGQLQWDWALDSGKLSTTADLYYDGVKDSVELQVRELAWQGRLSGLGQWGDNFDLKIGQQVLTWGTGDYVFINDLFPKDYQSFFSGRDDEYLKAPSLSAKLSGYFDWANVDLVVTPRFTSDTYINGEYFSFFNPMFGGNVAPEFDVVDENEPDSAEFAMRAYRSFDTTEVALYAYRGYQKTPSSADNLGHPMFARLNVWGASMVSPMGPGLFKAEYGFHDSVDDSDGERPNISNSQSRFLLGYEQELIANLTGSVQWYVEHTHDHDALLASSPWPQWEQKENRQVITTQLFYRAMQQTLTVNWFNFYSPSDDDGYMRVRVSYSPVDTWRVSVGANVFYGDKGHTFFNQFEDASNLFANYRMFF